MKRIILVLVGLVSFICSNHAQSQFDIKKMDAKNYFSINEPIILYDFDAVKYFIEKGVDLNMKYDRRKQTYGGNMYLLEKPDFPILYLLISYKENFTYKTLKLFIENGYNVNLQLKENGETALYHMIGVGYMNEDRLKIIQLLLENNADVKIKDKSMNTLLHILAEQCTYCDASKDDAKIAQLLIDRGAEVNAVNSEGKTPLKIAKKQKTKNVELIEVLKKAEMAK